MGKEKFNSVSVKEISNIFDFTRIIIIGIAFIIFFFFFSYLFFLSLILFIEVVRAEITLLLTETILITFNQNCLLCSSAFIIVLLSCLVYLSFIFVCLACINCAFPKNDNK